MDKRAAKSPRRVMYMHTMDGRPASFAMLNWTGGPVPYLYFVGGRSAAVLVPTLSQIRREQRAAIRQAQIEGENRSWAADPKIYGYVLVDVSGFLAATARRVASLAGSQ